MSIFPLSTRSVDSVRHVTGERPAPTPVPGYNPAVRQWIVGIVLSGALFAAACSPAQTPLTQLGVEQVFPNIELPGLLHLTWPDDDGSALYAVLQTGEVWRIEPGPSPSAQMYLDLTDRVRTTANEEGLLGLAFDPDFPSNGHLYVYYSASNPRRSVISRLIGDSLHADATSETLVMEVEQPFGNHNGGHIEFGPDGMLYVALGDGGGGGDPDGNGQNLSTLLGSILRIDISDPDVGANVREQDSTGGYRVPVDNPFVGIDGARPEIWAYGLRNLWRFAFDSESGRMWAGDVGENAVEEIDVITAGANFGWGVKEGSECFRSADCNRDGLVMPVAEYRHDSGCSVTGGRVYRGSRLPSLDGAYVYGDFCSGIVWSLR
jgi:glucose/arabinose dehydrogenase